MAFRRRRRTPGGFRLSRIVTRTGDRGRTGLADGGRVSKTHPRVEAGGEVDELNCVLGIVRLRVRGRLKTVIGEIQGDLFELGADLAARGGARLGADRIAFLDGAIDTHGGRRRVSGVFVIPGGPSAASFCHLARAVCRRAERRVVAVGGRVNPEAGRYLNRLSDFLYVIARSLSAGREMFWRSRPHRSSKPAP